MNRIGVNSGYILKVVTSIISKENTSNLTENSVRSSRQSTRNTPAFMLYGRDRSLHTPEKWPVG